MRSRRTRRATRDVEQTVREIVEDVEVRGDAALRDFAARFDGVELADLEVPMEMCKRALERLDPEVRDALRLAADNIAAFHRAQLPAPFEMETSPGVRLGRRADPLRRVGVYAPGGRAAYPSSVLMGVIPARVAGVDEIVVCSPPGPDGLPSAAVLAACALAGADRVFAVGGAGAIGALAYGTATIPPVDRIVGPGNAYVTEAKRQVNGIVAIDSPAGPSEILIIADDSADPTLVAAELIAQAEHDPDAVCVLVSTDADLASRTRAEITRLTATQPRAQIIDASMRGQGAFHVVDSLADAVRFAEEHAPEHLLIMTRDPRALLPAVRSAGTIFLGAPSSVAFGDYITGANHVLPTAGLARSYSGLSTADFLRWSTWQELTPAGAAELAAPTVALAEAEGLSGHALAARLRAAPGAAQPLQQAGGSRGNEDRRDGDSARDRAESQAPALRTAYADLALYDPAREPCELDLSDNTSLFGAAPSVRAALAATNHDRITRYPSVYADALRQSLARLHAVDASNIATGCGSDDVIDSALRAFCEPGDAVVYPEPTFGMIPAFARMNALRPVPLPSGFMLDALPLIQARARITYLCRPNNPTGTLFDREECERVCHGAAGIVLIDEAYADYADDDFVAHALASDNVVVLRTLSKAYGLAGLRVGYAIGPARLIAEIEKSRGPYKVSGIAEAAAVAVLTQDAEWVARNVDEVRASRDRLAGAVRSRGITCWDSAANFLLLKVNDAGAWNRALRERGVAVRPFTGLHEAGDCLRVSVGPWPMMQRFLDAFDDVLSTLGNG